MTLTELLDRSGVPVAAGPESPPAWTVGDLVERYLRMWWGTPVDTPALGAIVPPGRQRDNARECRRLIDDLARRIERCPDEPEARRLWRQDLIATIRQFGEERLAWPEGYRDLLFDEEFFEATRAFVREARAFDPAVRVDDLMQALRNVWIASSIQMLLDAPVRLTPSIFAYSMLYPYTDNYLDGPDVPREAKLDFCRRLGRCLAGEPQPPLSAVERQVFRLVERIEDEYPWTEEPDIHLSLLAIHSAQVASLAQQGRPQCPYETDLLRISVEKGGTSVLADAYLAAGRLAPREADFFFGYGVVLQLLDDLQDVRRDLAARHMTVFSQVAGKWPLDSLASRLLRLIERVIDDSPRFAAPRFAGRKDLLRRNCTFLLVDSIAENAELFSRGYLAELEQRSPVSLRARKRLRRYGAKRYRRLARSLERGRGLESVLDLVV